jgi:hypothetical protein
MKDRTWTIAALVAAAAAVAAVVMASSSHSGRDTTSLSPSDTARVAHFARRQARILGDPRVSRAIVILGPQTPASTGGPSLAKSEALIVLHGRFHCDHCRDSKALGLGSPWNATAVEYTVLWPSLGVRGFGADNGAKPLNLPPASHIKRLTIVTL